MLNVYIKDVDHVLKTDDFFIMYIKMLVNNLKNVDQVFEKC